MSLTLRNIRLAKMSGKFGLTFLKAKPLTAAERAEKYQSLRSDQVASVFGGDDSDEEVSSRHRE
jgi:hypothetical protein